MLIGSQFVQARYYLPSGLSHETMLNIPAATVGNVQTSRPGMFDMLGRAKYDAWAKQKDLGTREAKWQYVETLMKVRIFISIHCTMLTNSSSGPTQVF
jgi:Acyl CoA binding protein